MSVPWLFKNQRVSIPSAQFLIPKVLVARQEMGALVVPESSSSEGG